jgi:membrane protein YqaA with SNARE-associated domain
MDAFILILKFTAIGALLSWLLGLAIDRWIDRRQAQREAAEDEAIRKLLAQKWTFKRDDAA